MTNPIRLLNLFTISIIATFLCTNSSFASSEPIGKPILVKASGQVFAGKTLVDKATELPLILRRGDTVVTGPNGNAEVIYNQVVGMHLAPKTVITISNFERGDYVARIIKGKILFNSPELPQNSKFTATAYGTEIEARGAHWWGSFKYNTDEMKLLVQDGEIFVRHFESGENFSLLDGQAAEILSDHRVRHRPARKPELKPLKLAVSIPTTV
ncbi:MAG: hypothetical protein ACI9CF_000222 [Candidatus Omnitrophota bacterium]|jgi:hypothetical protein